MRGGTNLRASRTQEEAHIEDLLPGPAPFVDNIKSNLRGLDLILILGPPLVLVAVFLLPLETRLALGFDSRTPTIATALTGNYVHLAIDHLLANIVGYLLVIVVSYLLAVMNANQQRFYTVVIVILFVFPFCLSALNLLMPFPGILVGFSGLNMAILGYAFVEFSLYIETFVTDQFTILNSPGFFFLATSFVALRYAESTGGYGVFVVSLLAVGLYWFEFLPGFGSLIRGSRALFRIEGYVELLLASVLLFGGLVFAAFPGKVNVESGIVNIYVHLTGFCLGFITVFIWENISG